MAIEIYVTQKTYKSKTGNEFPVFSTKTDKGWVDILFTKTCNVPVFGDNNVAIVRLKDDDYFFSTKSYLTTDGENVIKPRLVIKNYELVKVKPKKVSNEQIKLAGKVLDDMVTTKSEANSENLPF